MRADYVVLGGGPAGCTVATLLAREGKDVLIVEQSAQPKASVGESLLPFGTRVIDLMGVSMDGFERKNGAVFTRGGERVRFPFAEGARPIYTHAWQVQRDLFDARFRAVAVEAGVRFLFAKVTDLELPHTLHTDQGPVHGRWLLDAGGRMQFFARKLGIRGLHPVLRNAAMSAWYSDVKRLSPEEKGDIAICGFEGGWFWFIPFADGQTSVGVVLTPQAKVQGDKWSGSLARCAEARARLEGATRTTALHGVQDFTAYADQFYGDSWALVGDAALFLDPVFSSGVLVSCEAAAGLAEVLLGRETFTQWEAKLRASASLFEKSILAWYDGSFMDVALCPPQLQKERYRRGIIGLLAGDVFEGAHPHVTVMADKFPVLSEMMRRSQLGRDD